MFELLTNLLTAFTLGLLTPLTAACVLPLYPGFLAYIANQSKAQRKKTTLASLGLIIIAGAISFMLLIGLIFTIVLQQSLNNVIGVVSPVAFGILAVISVALILNVDFTKIIPQAKTPITKNPALTAFLYGFFFGAIVTPCNPAFIAALFATAITTMGLVTNVLLFLSFGIGLSSPLLLFSLISLKNSNLIIRSLTKHKKSNKTKQAE